MCLYEVLWEVLSGSTPIREWRQIWAEEGVDGSFKAPGNPPKRSSGAGMALQSFPLWHKWCRLLYSYISQSLSVCCLRVRGITLGKEHDLGSNCSLWLRVFPEERLRVAQSWRRELGSTPQHPLQSIPYDAWIHLLCIISSGNTSSGILAGLFSQAKLWEESPHHYILSNGCTCCSSYPSSATHFNLPHLV